MRLDLFLLQHKNIESRTKAQDLIENGFVVYKNQIIKKPSFDVTPETAQDIQVLENDLGQYVSRAGHKLQGALHHLKLNVKDKIILDIGQSTGGFTDCLIQSGASFVVGVDVGSQQLHKKIRSLPAVKAFENLNVKDLGSHDEFKKEVPQKLFDGVVCDVSFISLTKVVAFLEPLIHSGAFFLFLVKPQFECGPENLDKNGIVADPKIYKLIESNITSLCEKIFSTKTEFFASSITGKDGNREFFIYGQKK